MTTKIIRAIQEASDGSYNHNCTMAVGYNKNFGRWMAFDNEDSGLEADMIISFNTADLKNWYPEQLEELEIEGGELAALKNAGYID